MEFRKLSHNDLPEAMAEMLLRLDRIEANQKAESTERTDQLMTVDQAAKFLTLAKPTIYAMLSRGELPNMKRGKRVYFERSRLLEYLQAGRRKSYRQLSEEVRTTKTR